MALTSKLIAPLARRSIGRHVSAMRPQVRRGQRFSTADKETKAVGGDAESSSSTKWFLGFVLIPCVLLPAYFIQGDVKDVKSGRIQRKNTTWNGV